MIFIPIDVQVLDNIEPFNFGMNFFDAYSMQVNKQYFRFIRSIVKGDDA